MRKILILMGRYLPGYKDGGPIRSIKNLTDILGDEYDFHIVCQDRDQGEDLPYPNIRYGEWNQVGKAKVWYTKPEDYTKKLILSLSEDMDVVYVCGFMNAYSLKALSLNRAGRFIDKTFSVAPMGLLTKGAIKQKSFKKKAYIFALKLLGLFDDILWSVTNEEEAEDVKKHLDRHAEYVVAEDLPRQSVVEKERKRTSGDSLKVIYISRISPEKNLLGAVKILQNLPESAGNVEFTVCGPCEDKEYWEQCEAELKKLPKSVNWNYKGEIVTDEVQKEFSKHDVFLFPTLGENYGHVIFEAMSAGCIPVISDRTPWRPDNYGYAIDLENNRLFADTLAKISNMKPEEVEELSSNALISAKQKIEDSKKNTGYRKIFDLQI